MRIRRVPVLPVDRERGEERRPDALVPDPGADDVRQRPRGEAVEGREAGAVDDSHARGRDAGRRHRRHHEPRAGGGRAVPAVERSELLEDHLGGEVVAVRVHRADDRAERGRAVDGERLDGVRRGPEPRRAGDPDAPGDELGCGGAGRRAAEAPSGDPIRGRARRRAPRAAASRCRRTTASSPEHRAGCRRPTRRRGSIPSPA